MATAGTTPASVHRRFRGKLELALAGISALRTGPLPEATAEPRADALAILRALEATVAAARQPDSYTKGVRVSPEQDLNWPLSSFMHRAPAVTHAAVVAAGGLPLASSRGFPADEVDQLAAITSGLISLVHGAARMFGAGPVTRTLVAMEDRILIIMSVSNGSAVAALAPADCDLGHVAYEMTLLSEQAGRILAPGIRGVPPAGRQH